MDYFLLLLLHFIKYHLKTRYENDQLGSFCTGILKLLISLPREEQKMDVFEERKLILGNMLDYVYYNPIKVKAKVSKKKRRIEKLDTLSDVVVEKGEGQCKF